MKTIGYLVLGFFIGRWSTFYIRSVQLQRIKDELSEEAARLDLLEKKLSEQDARIRQKWQLMVDDFSKYNAYLMKQNGNNVDTWNEWDDQYLSSWGSAENDIYTPLNGS